MKNLYYGRMLITICGLLILGCEKQTLVTEDSKTDLVQRSEQSTQKTEVFRDNLHLPVEFTAFSQCAGEELHFSGEFHINIHTVIDAKGGFHSVFIANDHSISGVGLTTGIKYHEVGATTEVFNVSGDFAPQEGTGTFTLNYIGQGPGNNAINRFQFHYTINANGVTTVEFVNFTQTVCR